jgi:hypothetical protein
MYQQIFKEIDEFIAKHPRLPRGLRCASATGANFCECEKCTELVRKYPDPDGSEVYTVQDVLFSNRIGKHFAKKYPKVRFNMLPYGSASRQERESSSSPTSAAASAELWRNHGLPADCNERSEQLRSAAGLPHGLAALRHLRLGLPDELQRLPDPLPQPHHLRAVPRSYYKRISTSAASPASMQFVYFGDHVRAQASGSTASSLWNPDARTSRNWSTPTCNAAYGAGARFVKEYLRPPRACAPTPALDLVRLLRQRHRALPHRR